MTSNHKNTEQNQYNYFLNSVLEVQLYATSSDLQNKLIENFQVSTVNARKIINRSLANKSINSSYPYTFGKRQYIYLYRGQVLDLEKIKNICELNRPPIYRLLTSLEYFDGIISYYEAIKITSSPLAKGNTKVQLLDEILKVLKVFNLVYEKKDSKGVLYILLKTNSKPGLSGTEEEIDSSMMDNHYQQMVLDCYLLPDILRWLRKSNIIDNIRVLYRNKKTPSIGATQNNLLWDAISYTKTTGINEVRGAFADTVEKQTLVVLDVVIAGEYTNFHLDGFIGRIQINLNSVKTGQRKIMPIVVYKACSELTLNRIAKLGFIAFDIGAIFGSKIYFVLQQISEVNKLFSVGEDIDGTISNILSTIRNSGQEDALKELKGVLFETLMYPLIKNLYPDATVQRNRTISRTVNNSKIGYEYDYIINSQNPNEVIVIELKGYDASASISLGSSNKKNSLKWFFDKTLPFAQTELKREFSKPVKALFITTANFWTDGQNYLSKMNLGKLKSSIMDIGYDREKLLQLLSSRGFKSEIRIIRKFYDKLDN